MARTATGARDRRSPLIPPAARSRVVALAAMAAGATALLGWRYADDRQGGRVDRHVGQLLDMQQGSARTFSQAVASLGGPVAAALALVALALLAWRLRGGRGLALVLVGPPLAMATTSLVLKPLVERTHGGELSFPSGHTTSVASLAVACAIVVLGRRATPRVLRWLVGAGLTGLVVAVAVALVGRGYHYPTDVVGALGVALAVVLLAALAVDVWADLLVEPDDRGVHEVPTEALPRLRRAVTGS